MKSLKTIQAFPALDLPQLFSSGRQHDPLLSGNRVRRYASGRAGLFHIIKSLALPEGSIILLPAYHCGVEVEAVLRAGCKVDFYRVGTDLGIDLENLCRKITSRTRGVMAVHYFGFPQELSSLRDICRRRDMVLIEDCAHALYSQDEHGCWLGTKADYGLFSMRKTVFMPNGGAVRVNRKGFVMPDKGKGYFELSIIKSAVKSALENEARKPGAIADVSQRLLDIYRRRADAGAAAGDNPDDDQRWYYDVAAYGYEHDISAISLACAGGMPFQNIISRRRQNYAALEKLLAPRFGDQFVHPALAPGVCPLCFPLFVDRRDELTLRMTVNNVLPFVFGRLPHPLLPEAAFPELQTLSGGIIGLPVHQQLTEQDMSVVADTLYNALER